MKAYVIRWSTHGYVAPTNVNYRPYVQNPKEAKRWKTRKNAERFLSLKDPGWASTCVIEEIDI